MPAHSFLSCPGLLKTLGKFHLRTVRLLLSAFPLLFFSVALADSSFVGSEKCASCHTPIYKAWQESKHSLAIQTLSPDNDTVIADWEGTVKLTARNIPEVSIRLSRGPEGQYLATLVDALDSSKELTYAVARTQGTGWLRGQRYQIKIGNNYHFLPMHWNPDSSSWDAFALDWWYDAEGRLKVPAANRTWSMTCAGCHHTGMVLTKVGEGYEVAFSEMNTGCEKCHGPGAAHVEASGTRETIINPRNLSYARGLDVCTQCHSMAASVPNGTFSYPWNDEDNTPYPVGEPLTDYYKPGGEFSPGAASEGSSLRTEHSLAKSRHYEGKTACFDCHDPHGSPARYQLARSEEDNGLCLHCHGKEEEFSSPAKIKAHTRHSYAPVGKGTSRCISCHRVRSRSLVIIDGIPMPGRRARFLEITSPTASLEMFRKNPKGRYDNSCNGCHTDWADDLNGYEKGSEAYKKWFLSVE